jgi:H+-transporting ATPase
VQAAALLTQLLLLLQGILTFLDPPRPDTKDTLERAMAYGVDVKMITGK